MYVLYDYNYLCKLHKITLSEGQILDALVRTDWEGQKSYYLI